MNCALRGLGYDAQTDITGHGFRAMARTLIRERLGWDRDRSMTAKHPAHVSDEEFGEAYDRNRFIEQRHETAQAWADYLDQLADQKTSTAFHHQMPAPSSARRQANRNGLAMRMDARR
ncbi:hypothetical protein ACLQ9R_02060 [Bordetella hinzii]|uniref:hypothetical protein n=1 Tax=Bordetella hinzii TaxID=103855 RepID=UPI0039FCA25B